MRYTADNLAAYLTARGAEVIVVNSVGTKNEPVTHLHATTDTHAVYAAFRTGGGLRKAFVGLTRDNHTNLIQQTRSLKAIVDNLGLNTPAAA